MQLAAAKLKHHENKINILQAKIGAVEQVKHVHANSSAERERFFCDCFQGLSTWYCKCLLERGWYAYPSEHWFVTSKSNLQIWSPLAKATVDYCDTASFSRCHSIMWEGGEHLEEKVLLAQNLDGTYALMPPCFAVQADGTWSELLCSGLDRAGKPSEVLPAVFRGKRKDEFTCEEKSGEAQQHECREATAAGAMHCLAGVATDRASLEASGISRWFVKDSTRNFGTGISVTTSVKEAQDKITSGDKYVVQLAIEPQLLDDEGYKFSCRVYLLAYSPPNSLEIEFYTYQEGWITRAQTPWVPGSLEWQHNVSRDRHRRLTAWNIYDEMYPKFRVQIARVLKRVKGKLVVKMERPSFELFGVDFINDTDHHPWIAEINRSPRQLETDKPMLHALLDLVLEEQRTPAHMASSFMWERLEALATFGD